MIHWPALIHFGHLLGIALLVGGLFQLARAASGPEEGACAAFARARMPFHIAAALILVTGILKWVPNSIGGGIGWLGGGGKYSGILHTKLLLGLATIALGIMAAKAGIGPEGLGKARSRARLAAWLGVLTMALAVVHRFQPFG